MNTRLLIYDQILISGLVSKKVLDEVYDELAAKLCDMNKLDSPDISPPKPEGLMPDLQPDPSESLSLIPPSPEGEGISSPGIHHELNSEGDLSASSSHDETDFELGEFVVTEDSSSASIDFSDESKEIAVFLSGPFEEEMTRLLPAELELRGLINRWQISQLLRTRTRFTLGNYRMIDSLGLGGYGHVFLARPKSDTSNQPVIRGRGKHEGDVAIKVLPLALETDSSSYKFLREAQVNKLTIHDNIVRFIETARDGNVHYTVYEFIDGGDVRKLIKRYERLDYRLASQIIVETAKALKYLHETGFVHRDVKPGNILLTRSGQVKLIDMGLVVTRNDTQFVVRTPQVESLLKWESEWNRSEPVKKPEESRSHRKKVAGTPDYIAPDQIRDPATPSPLWDIYSLGCTFYFMVTGIVPFPAGNTTQKMQAQLFCDPPEPRMFNQELPEEVSKFILAMMAKEPGSRISSAREVISFLERYIPGMNMIARYLTRPQDSLLGNMGQNIPLGLTGTGEPISSRNGGFPGIDSGQVPGFGSERLAYSKVIRNLAADLEHSHSGPPPVTNVDRIRHELRAEAVTSSGFVRQIFGQIPKDKTEKLEKFCFVLTNYVLFPLLWVAIVMMIIFLFLSL